MKSDNIAKCEAKYFYVTSLNRFSQWNHELIWLIWSKHFCRPNSNIVNGVIPQEMDLTNISLIISKISQIEKNILILVLEHFCPEKDKILLGAEKSNFTQKYSHKCKNVLQSVLLLVNNQLVVSEIEAFKFKFQTHLSGKGIWSFYSNFFQLTSEENHRENVPIRKIFLLDRKMFLLGIFSYLDNWRLKKKSIF